MSTGCEINELSYYGADYKNVTNDIHRVLDIRHLTPRCFCLKVERKNVVFKAGQCFNLGMPGEGVNREYSSYAGEKDNYIEFLIKVVEDGVVSTKLQKLRPGDQVEVAGAYGEFTFREKHLNREFTFIATGTGIAPFRSYVRTYPQIKYQIIHGIRQANETYDIDQYLKESYIPCVSRERKDGFFNGRVTDYLNTNPVDKENIFYLCGNRNMIAEVFDVLTIQGVNGSNIFTEVFF